MAVVIVPLALPATPALPAKVVIGAKVIVGVAGEATTVTTVGSDAALWQPPSLDT